MQQPIIVFDSGRGGQSIFEPLKKALPNANLIYRDDRENFPYGSKSPAWLSARFREFAVEFAALNPRLLVLACNTATVNIIEELRQRLTCPIVGVEPVIKPLAKYNSALALMTSAAAKSTRTAELLKTYGPHVKVYVPSGLAEAIEYNDNDQVKIIIHEIRKIAQKHHVEAVGLSCTHFPLVIDEFKLAMPGVDFIDPSDAVVREVSRVLRLTEHE